MSPVIPVDPHLIAAGKNDFLPAIAVQVGQQHLHSIVTGQTHRLFTAKTAFSAPVDERVGVVFKPVPVVGHYQIGVTISRQVSTAERSSCNADQPESLCGILEMPWPLLNKHLNR